jgi:hypothetical protein
MKGHLPTARVVAAWWQRLVLTARAKLHRCTDCRILDTDEGIGGQCVECGRVHGWMTRDELRRACLMPHIVPTKTGPDAAK